MIRSWTTSLRVTAHETTLLVVDAELGDVLKARLPMPPRHPRALLTLLEGLALFAGQPLSVAISAAWSSAPWLDSGLFGDELWPAESLLVRFVAARPGRRRRLDGLGSFHALRVREAR
jgi:hypothetical protein